VSWSMALAMLAGLLLGIVAALVMVRMLYWREAELRASVQDLAAKALRDNADMFLKLAREALGRERATHRR
jgi:CHASE3 domain sensor protein